GVDGVLNVRIHLATPFGQMEKIVMNEVQVAHLLAAGALLVGEDLSRLLSAMDRVGPKAVRHMIDGLEFARSRGHTVDLDYLTGWWASAKGDEHVDDDLFEILLNMHDRE